MRDDHGTGHLGCDKTIDSISMWLYFPGLKDKVSTYVTSCEYCERVKTGSKFEKGSKTLITIDILNGVWYNMGIDLITNLPETPEGYNKIVAMINYRSKWVKAAPLTSKDAYQVAHCMYSTMCRMGQNASKIFISDQGCEFCNEVIDEFTKLKGTKKM